MLPEIECLANGRGWQKMDVMKKAGDALGLDEEQKAQFFEPDRNGHRARKWLNAAGWGITYLQRAGLVEKKADGLFYATAEGIKVANDHPDIITRKFLKEKYPDEMEDFLARKAAKKAEAKKAADAQRPETLDEALDNAWKAKKKDVSAQLLAKVREIGDGEFEGLVVDLIAKMGYGDGSDEASLVVGKSGDGGVDGVIKTDPLGLDLIYIQAKHYKDGNNVSPHDVRDFVGAMTGKPTKKGVFITSSAFTEQAVEFAKANTAVSIKLIDGDELIDLLYKYGVGVQLKRDYKSMEIDDDYFDQLKNE